jgi:uncharacterized membrane protein
MLVPSIIIGIAVGCLVGAPWGWLVFGVIMLFDSIQRGQ